MTAHWSVVVASNDGKVVLTCMVKKKKKSPSWNWFLLVKKQFLQSFIDLLNCLEVAQ